MKTKNKPVRAIITQTYFKGENIINMEYLKELIEKGLVEGYIIKDGALSDGNSFSEIHLTIKKEEK